MKTKHINYRCQEWLLQVICMVVVFVMQHNREWMVKLIFLWLVENMEGCVLMSKGIVDGPWWMVYSLLNGCDYTYVDVNWTWKIRRLVLVSFNYVVIVSIRTILCLTSIILWHVQFLIIDEDCTNEIGFTMLAIVKHDVQPLCHGVSPPLHAI